MELIVGHMLVLFFGNLPFFIVLRIPIVALYQLVGSIGRNLF